MLFWKLSAIVERLHLFTFIFIWEPLLVVSDSFKCSNLLVRNSGKLLLYGLLDPLNPLLKGSWRPWQTRHNLLLLRVFMQYGHDARMKKRLGGFSELSLKESLQEEPCITLWLLKVWCDSQWFMVKMMIGPFFQTVQQWSHFIPRKCYCWLHC